MKNTRKAIALLLAFVFILTTFAGCKKEESDPADAFRYVATAHTLDCGELEYVENVAMSDSKVYFFGQNVVGTETETDPETGDSWDYDVYGYAFYSANLDGTDLKKLDYTVDMDGNMLPTVESPVESYNWVAQMFVTNDGRLFVIRDENITTFELPSDYDPSMGSPWEYPSTYSENYYLDIVGADGKLQNSMLISGSNYDESEEYFGINGIVEDKEGNFYAYSWNEMRAYDKDFNELYRVKDEQNGFSNLFVTYGGDVVTTRWNDEYTVLSFATLDKNAHSFVSGATAPSTNIYTTYTGNEEYDFFYTSSNSLYGAHLATGEAERILSWLDSDINPDTVRSVHILDNENVACLTMDWGDEGNTIEIVNLKKTDVSTLPEQKKLTVACIYLDYQLQRDILAFNKSGNGYRIEVRDYSEYNTGEDYNAGITKLNAEIISGNVPDIFLLGGSIPADRYAAKGILVDLTPYLEKTLGKDGVVEEFYKTLRNDKGELFEVYPNFSLETAIALKKVVGDRTSWNAKELMDVFATMPEGATVFGNYYDKESALYSCVLRNLGHFINWETGECRFDSQEFIDLLKFTEHFPKEINWDDPMFYEVDYAAPISEPFISEEPEEESEKPEEEVPADELDAPMEPIAIGEPVTVEPPMVSDPLLTGKQLLTTVSLYGLTDFRGNTFYRYGNDFTFIGFPDESGNGATFTGVGTGFAITTACKEKDAAWDFISKYMTEEYQSDDGYWYEMPTNKAAFDKMMEAERTPDFPKNKEENDNRWIPEGVVYTYSKGVTNAQGFSETPKSYVWNDSNGGQTPVYAMTDEEYNAIMELFKNTTTFARYDSSITDILTEEVQAYFEGQKSAEETAKMLQSRIKLYVNEQR